jgi:hypothetical protein
MWEALWERGMTKLYDGEVWGYEEGVRAKIISGFWPQYPQG